MVHALGDQFAGDAARAARAGDNGGMTVPTERRAIARAAADALESLTQPQLDRAKAVVGFDGFIDSIIQVVDKRHAMTAGGFTPLKTIGDFAARAAAAAGKSANLELVTIEDRFGGNGPLLAGALGRLGMPVTYIGAVGRPESPTSLHPIFRDFAARCRGVLPVSPPAFTDALEFDDGKLMLNRAANVQGVDWELIRRTVGLEKIRSIVTDSSLIGMVNWTVMAGVNSIWRGLRDEVLPALPSRKAATNSVGPDRSIFVDLTDPAKRTDADIAEALGLLRELDVLAPVTLGLNLSEAERIARVASVSTFDRSAGRSTRELVESSANGLRAALGLDAVVIHPREGAGGATADGQSAWFDGPFTRSPKLSTGAGDHFNGGYSFATTLGLRGGRFGSSSGVAPSPGTGLATCLAIGCAVSGAYVRDAESPTRKRLVEFLRDLPEPERDGDG